MSEPCIRDIRTIRLKPSLASQAPNVSRTSVRMAEGFPISLIAYGINRTIVSITPSSESSDIRRCDWCVIKDAIARIGAS